MKVRISVFLCVVFAVSTSWAQLHQSKLYIDDGSGNFLILQAPSGGGTLTLPGSSVAFPSANTSGVLINDGGGTLSWGTAGFTPAYANAYTTSISAVVAGGTIPITTVAISSGFTSNGSGAFTVTATGVYKVEFSVVTSTANRIFAIEVNGVEAANTEVGSSTSSMFIHNDAILSLTAGDVVTVINESGAAITLAHPTANSLTASITAVRIE